MTFEKNGQIVEISLKDWVMEFDDGTIANMRWLSEIPLTMQKLAYIESRGFRQIIFDVDVNLDFAMFPLS
jgi:hypothetical protein